MPPSAYWITDPAAFPMLLNLFIVCVLIVLNGVLAMSELAVVSSRAARLQAMQRRGVRGARTALDLRGHPGRFLSTVQIGITLVGVLAGAFSGATLAGPLAEVFVALGFRERFADDLALAVVVAGVTYLSLIVGELVPKQLALRSPERVAAIIAPPMLLLSRLARPLVWLLDVSSGLVLRLIPRRSSEAGVTDEEIHALVAEAASTGVVEPEERIMIAAVMRLADRTVRALMTPRKTLEWINLDDPIDAQLATMRRSRHSKMIAARGDIDHFVGVISAKHIVDALIDGADRIVPALHVEDALVVPETIDALDMIPKLRRSSLHAAIVVDEFGSLQGLVTVTDVLAAIAGEFLEDGSRDPGILQRADGSWLVDGELDARELAETMHLPLPADHDYETVAGLVLALLGHLPKVGETVELDDWLFEVVDLDGRRVDKLLLTRRAPDGPRR